MLSRVDGGHNEPMVESSRLCSLGAVLPVGAIINLKRGKTPQSLADEASDELASASIVATI